MPSNPWLNVEVRVWPPHCARPQRWKNLWSTTAISFPDCPKQNHCKLRRAAASWGDVAGKQSSHGELLAQRRRYY